MSSQTPPKLPLSAIAALLGQQKNAPGNQPLSPLVEALLKGANPPQPNALGSLFSTPTPTPPPPLGSLFGLASSPSLGAGIGSKALGSIGSPVPPVAPTPRNVFYSFHYADIFRVNHIRNSGKIRATDKGRNLTPRDRSLWESVKRTNPANLKRVINAGLGGTSTTCVLAGYETWSRPWVRYEIARSLMRGNALLTVYIDGCKCPREGYGMRGSNPLAAMALGWDNRIYEHRGGQWVVYSEIEGKVPGWPKWLPRPSEGRVMPLDQGAPAYDWITDDGYNNLIRWANLAAVRAGK